MSQPEMSEMARTYERYKTLTVAQRVRHSDWLRAKYLGEDPHTWRSAADINTAIDYALSDQLTPNS